MSRPADYHIHPKQLTRGGFGVLELVSKKDDPDRVLIWKKQKITTISTDRLATEHDVSIHKQSF